MRRVLCLIVLCGAMTTTDACLYDRDRFCDCNRKLREVSCSGLPDSVDTILPAMIRWDTRILKLQRVWVDDAVELWPRNFEGLRRLVRVDLSHNRISSIKPQTFRDMVSLSDMNLSHNRLQLIEIGAFSGNLPKLERINLSNNKLLIIVNRNFKDAVHLKYLDLRNNHILFVAAEAFWGLASLEVLAMSSANMTIFPAEAICAPTKLRLLDLRDMPFISSIPPHTFACNEHLEELVLERFPRLSLRGIHHDTFAGLGKLRALTLASTNLTAIPSTALSLLRNLEKLDLSRNLISEIYPDDFRTLTSLQHIILHSTGLRGIHPGAFSQQRKIRSLDVSNNRLTTLYDDIFPMNISSLRNVTMTYNAWSCDCSIRWLVESDISLGPRPVTCTQPSALQGTSLIGIKSNLPESFYNCTGPFFRGPMRHVVTEPEGGLARLPCNVFGVHPISVSWTRKGIVVGTATVLRVKAKRYNAGKYTCTVRNAGGERSKTVTLKVVQSDESDNAAFASVRESAITEPTGLRPNEIIQISRVDGGYSSIAIPNETFERQSEEASWSTTALIAVLGCSTGIGLIIMCILVIVLWKRNHHRNMKPVLITHNGPQNAARYREHGERNGQGPPRVGAGGTRNVDHTNQRITRPVGGQGIYSRPIEMIPMRDTD